MMQLTMWFEQSAQIGNGEVWHMQVANREHRWLKKSSEHHPGYAISRTYLETLADLPWSHFSGQAGPHSPGATNSEHPSQGMTVLPCLTTCSNFGRMFAFQQAAFSTSCHHIACLTAKGPLPAAAHLPASSFIHHSLQGFAYILD